MYYIHQTPLSSCSVDGGSGDKTRGTGACSHHKKKKILVYSEIASEAVFGHKYHSFSLTCMLASHPHESGRTCLSLVFDLGFPHYFYPGTSEFSVGTGPGMPGCSYATESLYSSIICLHKLHARSCDYLDTMQSHLYTLEQQGQASTSDLLHTLPSSCQLGQTPGCIWRTSQLPQLCFDKDQWNYFQRWWVSHNRL